MSEMRRNASKCVEMRRKSPLAEYSGIRPQNSLVKLPPNRTRRTVVALYGFYSAFYLHWSGFRLCLVRHASFIWLACDTMALWIEALKALHSCYESVSGCCIVVLLCRVYTHNGEESRGPCHAGALCRKLRSLTSLYRACMSLWFEPCSMDSSPLCL